MAGISFVNVLVLIPLVGRPEVIARPGRYEPVRRHASSLAIMVIVRKCHGCGDSKDCRE